MLYYYAPSIYCIDFFLIFRSERGQGVHEKYINGFSEIILL